MNITISDDLLDRNNLSLEELLYLILLDNQAVEETITASLEMKGWLHEGHLTEESRQKLASVLYDKEKEPSSDMRIDILTEQLMRIFPKGKKEGTPYYWKGNRKEIKEKLKKFFVYFGDTYTDAQILSAAQRYVDSFNGNYRFMRLLKYFIWKNDTKLTTEGRTVEQVSELASYIENAGTESSHNEDWTSCLV